MVADSGHDSAGHARDDPGPTGRQDASSAGRGGGAADSGYDQPDPRSLARDWIALWQSELAAMAADPEMQEAWQTMASLWAGAMTAMLQAVPRGRERHDPGHRRSGGRAGTADAPGPAPAAAAPDPRDAEINRLARHVAALERRLADLERGGRPPVDPKRRARRKPRGRVSG